MARNDGKKFEVLLHDIYTTLVSNEKYTSVERNIQLVGHDGPRQIDVLIKSQVAGMPLLTVVECRDFNKRLDVTSIDAFQSKLVDVGANKGVLVSRKGFSSTAMQKAKRVGITLCTASNATEILSALEIQIPVVMTEVEARVQNYHGSIHLDAETTFNQQDIGIINDSFVSTVFRDEVLQGLFNCPLKSGAIIWEPKIIQPPYYIRDVSGKQHFFEQLEFPIYLTVTHYFGYMNDLPEAYALHNQAEGSTHVFLKAEDFPNAKQRLAKYSDPKMIPKVNAIYFSLIAIPTFESTTFTFSNLHTGEKFTLTK